MQTPTVYLEHANITVRDLDKAIRFFQTAFPGFEIRGSGINNNRKWIHLGNDNTYLALNEGAVPQSDNSEGYGKNGFNHIGFVVDDVAAIAQRLEQAGFHRDYPKQVQQFRIRDYFADADGNQYEFVEYLSDVPAEKNSYAD